MDPTPLPAALKRPQAPLDLDMTGEFRPAPELEAWARAAFIDEHGALMNPEHAHLRYARVRFLWTNVANGRHMKAIAATCELGKPQGQGRWAKARSAMQIRQWFGEAPHFIITVWTGAWEADDDWSACALIEHELKHAGQEIDEFGTPKFRKDGSPAFGLLGHDVEEFTTIVARYGADTACGARELVTAANKGPSVGEALIKRVCGTCNRKAA